MRKRASIPPIFQIPRRLYDMRSRVVIVVATLNVCMENAHDTKNQKQNGRGYDVFSVSRRHFHSNDVFGGIRQKLHKRQASATSNRNVSANGILCVQYLKMPLTSRNVYLPYFQHTHTHTHGSKPHMLFSLYYLIFCT